MRIVLFLITTVLRRLCVDSYAQATRVSLNMESNLSENTGGNRGTNGIPFYVRCYSS